jgi:hypothetical protein
VMLSVWRSTEGSLAGQEGYECQEAALAPYGGLCPRAASLAAGSPSRQTRI